MKKNKKNLSVGCALVSQKKTYSFKERLKQINKEHQSTTFYIGCDVKPRESL